MDWTLSAGRDIKEEDKEDRKQPACKTEDQEQLAGGDQERRERPATRATAKRAKLELKEAKADEATAALTALTLPGYDSDSQETTQPDYRWHEAGHFEKQGSLLRFTPWIKTEGTEERNYEADDTPLEDAVRDAKALNFFQAEQIRSIPYYFDSTIHAYFVKAIEKANKRLQLYQVTELEFTRVLLSVQYFVTLASLYYRTHRFNKPGLPPGHPELYEVEQDLRCVPLAEILIPFSSKPVRIHEDLLGGLELHDGTLPSVRTYFGEYREVPTSAFLVSAKLVTLALHFLSSIGLLEASYGRYDEQRGAPSLQDKEYGVTLAELEYLAKSIRVEEPHHLLRKKHTFYFRVPYEFPNSWTGLVRQVIARYADKGLYEAGFEYSFVTGSRTYTWDPANQPFWCPVLRKDFVPQFD